MVHKFKNRVENFLFSEMPVDSMDYERKGGCFVTTLIPVILTILFLLLGFIFGLLVYYTTKHVYQTEPPVTLKEFINNYNDDNGYSTEDSQNISPKHYRLIINPILNDTLTFNGNVWITLTPSEDGVKTIELDITNLDIRADEVSVYRSRILSDANFQSDRKRRSAQLSEDDVSVEKHQSDTDSAETIEGNDVTDTEKESEDDDEKDQPNLQTNSTEWIDTAHTAGVEKESQENVDNSTTEPTETAEDSSEPLVTEYIDDNNGTWDGLFNNDSLLLESNPDEQTELEIDDIQFNIERKKLIITLSTALRKGHYYIVKVFFTGNMSSDYGLVYKPVDDADTDENFIAATITDTRHTSAVFPCFNDIEDEVTFQLNVIRHVKHQSVSVSKLMRSEKM